MLDIGEKLREARNQQNLSLRELAAKAEVSASLLSQIENGKANPSVRSLHSIAEALSMSVDHFFPQKKEDDVATPLEQQVVEQLGVALTASELRTGQNISNAGGGTVFRQGGAKTKGPVAKVGDHPTIELQGGVTWTRLTPETEEGVEFLKVCYDVGATSGEKMSHHTGREFGMVLEGILQIELGFETYVLHPGDTIIFDSTTPHRMTNIGDVPMWNIWVVFNR